MVFDTLRAVTVDQDNAHRRQVNCVKTLTNILDQQILETIETVLLSLFKAFWGRLFESWLRLEIFQGYLGSLCFRTLTLCLCKTFTFLDLVILYLCKNPIKMVWALYTSTQFLVSLVVSEGICLVLE